MQAIESEHQFKSLADAKAFALAGNAILTIQSAKTGTHFTFKIQAPKEVPGRDPFASDIRFVKVLAGGNADEGNWSYLGMIQGRSFRLTKGSRAGAESPSVKAFTWFWTVLQTEAVAPNQLIIRHENHCGRCGRTLTHPESIDRGIGPECAQLMSL